MADEGDSDREHAIVAGGSMAGLLAARVLADRYRRVTLVERDTLPQAAEHRRGVPQGRHTHALLVAGRGVLQELFPDLSAELVEAGAVEGDATADARWFFEGAHLKRHKSGVRALLLSRPFLEAAVRSRVLRLPNLTLRQDSHVEGLTASSDNSHVTGVQLAGEALLADLVVDATGRGSHSPRWLESLGYEKPEEERVEVSLAYTTRLFRRRTSDLDGDVAAVIPPTPEGKRGGVMLALEGDRWTVTLIEHFGSSAPPDREGFVEFARSLPSPDIYEGIRDAEPLGDAVQARFPASLRRRYERLTRFPEGYLVLGDAVSSFNPIYGQGMSVAALQAKELQRVLRERPARFAPTFFRRTSKVIDNPWSIAVGNDLRMPEAKGKRTAAVNLVNWYMSKLHRAAHRDGELSWAFVKVTNLLAPPPSVLHPRIAARVLRGVLYQVGGGG